MTMRQAGTWLIVGLAAVAAQADPVGHIGNTLLIKRPDGVGRMMYRADNSFTLVTAKTSALAGKVIHGTWRAVGGKLCLTPRGDVLKPFCVADDPDHKVGDTWDVLSPEGKPETLTLVAGQ